jgi:hypothetical protein
MMTLAFLLDGHRRFHPPLPVYLAAYIMPAVAIACCCIVARNPRLVSYAVTVAAAGAAVILIPLYRVAINIYEDAYETSDLVLFWFLILLPFASIVGVRQAVAMKPNQRTRANGHHPSSSAHDDRNP